MGGDRQAAWPSLSYSYSSCVLSAGQCPDGECDPLEALEPSLCPQDCVPSQNIILSLLVNSQPGQARGIVSVKAPNMTCKCEEASCQCFHTRYELGLLAGAEQVQARDQQTCDDHCVLLITAASSISLALLLLLTAVWRKRLALCSGYVKDKAKVQYEEGGFSSELEDYSRCIIRRNTDD